MTRDEHYAVNLAGFYALKSKIDAEYPPKQFVAIAGGKIVADDADFMELDRKLTELGIGTMEALIERAGDRLPVAGTFRGALSIFSDGNRTWNSATPTGVR